MKLIETAWEGYRKHVLFDTDTATVAALRIAFYAGARAAVFAARIADHDVLAEMIRELNTFQIEMEEIAEGE